MLTVHTVCFRTNFYQYVTDIFMQSQKEPRKILENHGSQKESLSHLAYEIDNMKGLRNRLTMSN